MEIPKYLISFRKMMVLRNYSKNTIENYVCQVDLFLREMQGKFTEPTKLNLFKERKPNCIRPNHKPKFLKS